MASVINSPIDSLFPLPPASTFIIEVWEAPDDPQYPWEEGVYIRAYLNDQYVPFFDCMEDPCTAQTMLDILSMPDRMKI